MQRTILAISTFLLLLAPVQAQTAFRSIMNEGTGRERQTTTTQNGVYRLSDLAVGFQLHQTKRLNLNANRSFGVQVVHRVSGTTTEIQVAATAAAVETSTLSYVNLRLQF